MTEQLVRKCFDRFMICRAGSVCGVLSRRESNLARSCFCMIVEDRSLLEQQMRCAGILKELAEKAEGVGV